MKKCEVHPVTEKDREQVHKQNLIASAWIIGLECGKKVNVKGWDR